MNHPDPARPKSLTVPLAVPLAAALGSVLAVGGVARAQTTPEAPRQPAQLTPIAVEGQADAPYKVEQSSNSKFTAPLVDTPKSVTIIPQELINSTASSTLVDALRTTPGITFGAGEGGNPLGDRPFIRGYDAQASTFIDGLRDIGATSREVFNLEQIEVTKGPDGAYGGRGGAGGSLNLISKTAKAENFVSGSLGLGTDNYKRGTVDGNWRLGDNAAFRLNAMAHDADVPGRDAVDVSRWSIAPTLTLGLNSPTRVILSYYHMQTDDLPDSGIPFRYGTAASIPAGVTEISPVSVNRHNFYGLANSDFRKTRSDIATARIEHDFDNGLHIRNTTRYTDATQRYVYTQPDDSQGNVNRGLVWRRANTRNSDTDSIANQTEIYGKKELFGVEHSFTTGVEFSREESHVGSYIINTRGAGSGAANACAVGSGAVSGYNCASLYNPNPNDPWTGTITPGDKTVTARVTSASIYGFDTIKWSDQWLTNIGLRVDDYRTRYNNTAGTTPQGTNARRDDTLFNYQLGLIYKPAPNGSVYASYATSSTPVGSNLTEGAGDNGITPGRGNVGLNAADLAPEKNKSLEFGTKWNLLNNNLAVNAAVFRIETTNARVTNPDNTYSMSGGRSINGFELGASGNITNKWQVFGGYTFLKSKITDNGPVLANQGAVGQEFPNTPEHSFSLWSTYNVLPDLSIGGGAFYTGKQYGSAAAVRRYIPGALRFDAVATYRINRNLTAQLNVLNLTNKFYYTSTYSTHYASVGNGRAAIASLNFRY